MHGKILVIAGSDPSGGAGIQADIKTISALGGYGMAAITALTVQNTQKVYSVHPVLGNIVSAQVMAVLQDITPDAIKVGMMGSAEVVDSLAPIFADYNTIPLIVDPVILSTSGYLLFDQQGIERMIADIFPNISLLTPNIMEAAFLTGMDDITTIDDMKRAAERLRTMGPRAVLMKGGHLSGDVLTDILMTGDGIYEYSSPRIKTNNTHGTGCSLASAIATGIGQEMALPDAVHRAHHYIHRAIETAPGYGQGKGPLNHLVRLD